MPDLQEEKKKSKLIDGRVIGKYSSGKEGPLLLVTAAVHGNEPSGVMALNKIFEKLEDNQPEIAGTFLALAGNVEALKREQRYIDRDLNRVWPDKRNDDFQPQSHEEKEMLDIWKTLDEHNADGFQERYHLDCHSTSSDSLPYISVQEVGKNDLWAHRFPLHIVRGFSDLVHGSIDRHFSNNGYTSFTFEGGEHLGEHTVDHQEGLIWLALKKANDLNLEKIHGLEKCIQSLTPEEGPQTFKILYRHGLKDGDTFKMKKGFENFQPISKGEYLAEHNGEEIHSKWDARIFMPLYQAQGNDGFFVIEKVERGNP